MRILHVTASPFNSTGGVPSVLRNLSKKQDEIAGIQVKVLSLCAKISDDIFLYLEKRRIRKFVESYLPDVAVFHSVFHIEYVYVTKILVSFNIPYFIEAHGSFGAIAMKKSYIKKYLSLKTIFLEHMKKAKGYIFLSEAEMNNSVFRTSNDLIIPNGIEENVIKHSFMPNVRKTDLYYIGRYDLYYKGLDILFAALDILEKERYCLCIDFWGTGDKRIIEYMNNKIKTYIYVKARLHDPILKSEMPDSIEQLSPMILISRSEGFPMTVLEAWSYGNPCIVTPGTNVYEEVKKNDLGWCTELDPKAIADVIKKSIMEYRSNKNFYIERTKNYVEQNYLWNMIAQESINKFRNLLC